MPAQRIGGRPHPRIHGGSALKPHNMLRRRALFTRIQVGRICRAIHSRAVPVAAREQSRPRTRLPMTTPSAPFFSPGRRLGKFQLFAVAIGASAALLAGCNKNKDKDKAATQTAAKVNKEEITVHQINFLLSQRRPAPPEQAADRKSAV